MRITDVRAVHPHTPADPPDWRSSLGQILVAVDTAEGVRGYGVGGGGPTSIYVIDEVLKPLLLGEDPHDAERLWQKMYNATAMFGCSGLVIMAISGVELALWDAWAKAEERSVAALDPRPLAESGRHWVTWLDGQPPIVDGYVDLPDRPGFGVEPVGPAADF